MQVSVNSAPPASTEDSSFFTKEKAHPQQSDELFLL
jgi:hypothetical protein